MLSKQWIFFVLISQEDITRANERLSTLLYTWQQKIIQFKNVYPYLPHSLTWATLHHPLSLHGSHWNCVLVSVQMTVVEEENYWNSHHSLLQLLLAHKADELKDELIPSQSFFQCLEINYISLYFSIQNQNYKSLSPLPAAATYSITHINMKL